MQIITDDYKACEAAINDLQESLDNTVAIAKKVSKALAKLPDGEARLLVIMLGKIMDEHKDAMEKI